ncbi:hypothetical protein AJ80_02985 [Polytolypa hystricis UAMH7299]|uniref:YCII-related domain-containing protein n=1 Tax=Polytolypa hystricis (strain UAMH7299) TaxID=1447883 RepID=A0A2B7YMV9_POLH7|nr:hypothetical protein AJ80_02985 [Polytolypa hystricis UAMH7299]
MPPPSTLSLPRAILLNHLKPLRTTQGTPMAATTNATTLLSLFPRGMATSSTPTELKKRKNEYLIIVPDKEESLARRLEVRGTHLANIKPIIISGFLKLGGSILDYHPTQESETPPMKGSVLIAVAESEEEVREVLLKDVYVTAGVWDVEKGNLYGPCEGETAK